MSPRDLRLAILRGEDDDAVQARALQLGWSPPAPDALDELARRADEDLAKLLHELSARPYPHDSTRRPQE